VYRPATGPFPLSRRPREAFELHRDGSAVLFDAGADDRSVPHAATWTDTPDGIVVVDEQRGVRYRVVDQAPAQLIVRRD